MSKRIETLEEWNAIPVGTKLVESFGSAHTMIRATKVSDTEYTAVYIDALTGEHSDLFKKDFVKEFNNHFTEVELA
jgi:hypothetical protein